MAMINCKECNEEISMEAKACPKCGQPNKEVIFFAFGISFVLFAGLIQFFYGGGLEKQVAKDLNDIHKQVASEALTIYYTAEREGSPIDVCVQAGIVSAAYLQANDETNYRTWKSREKRDCLAAGL